MSIRTRRSRPVRVGVGLAALAACLAAGACGTEGGRTDYSADGDTGAASPGTAPDMSTAKMGEGPDSTLGVGGRTGAPGVAGDTLSSRGRPAGATDSLQRATADSARRRRP